MHSIRSLVRNQDSQHQRKQIRPFKQVTKGSGSLKSDLFLCFAPALKKHLKNIINIGLQSRVFIGFFGFEFFSDKGLHNHFRCVIFTSMKEVPVRHPTRVAGSDRTGFFISKNTKGKRTMQTASMRKKSNNNLKTRGNKAFASACSFLLDNDSRYINCGRLRC